MPGRDWSLPTPLLLFAGVVALWPLMTLVQRPRSNLRLFVEALASVRAAIAVFWQGWVAWWPIAQHW